MTELRPQEVKSLPQLQGEQDRKDAHVESLLIVVRGFSHRLTYFCDKGDLG